VPEDASPAEARRAYLGKLRESAFLPPRSWQQAVRVLDGKPAPAEPDEEWLAEEEARLRAEVDSFAEEFFTLPVDQRRERWEGLLSRCQNLPPLVVRLQALKAGLVVEKEGLPEDGSPTGLLADHLLQSFPLPPLSRAASRQEFLRRLEESSADSRKLWEKAARYLRAEWPAVAALDEELVRYVAQLSSRLKWRRKMHRRSEGNRQAGTAAGSQKPSRWWIVVGMVVAAILRGVSSSDKPSPNPAPWPLYSGPKDGAGLKGLEHLRGRIATHPTIPVPSRKFFPDLPPVQELLDPSKYDLEVQDAGGSRTLRFTPRPTTGGSKGPQANNGRPVFLGEATLRLLGVPKEQIDAACSRAAGRKAPDDKAAPPREEPNPKGPKLAPGDKARP
jgi:hypothetical protein